MGRLGRRAGDQGQLLLQLQGQVLAGPQNCQKQCVSWLFLHSLGHCFANFLRSRYTLIAGTRKETPELDEFWSHSWHERATMKYANILFLSNGTPASRMNPPGQQCSQCTLNLYGLEGRLKYGRVGFDNVDPPLG